MATQITNYQCPACTGPLQFSGESGKLECEFCGSSFEVAEVEALYAQKEAAAAEAMADAEAAAAAEEEAIPEEFKEACTWDENGMKAYNCPSCGAELICDATTAATSCPSCGNPTVVPGQFAGALKPDYVIPFKVTKDEAIAAMKNFYKGKFLLPKVFAQQNQIEKIQGVYVPFWLFDNYAEGSARYEATIKRTYRSGDYQITETDHYAVSRSGYMSFEKVPVDGSTKMPDDYMDSIEPYNYEELRAFSTAYLPGYLADKYDVSLEDSAARADERCKGSLRSSLESTVVGYTTVSEKSADVSLERGNVGYALLPVWLLSTRWNDQNFLFAINGQTGKAVGALPMDKGKFWALLLSLSVGLSVVCTLITGLIM